MATVDITFEGTLLIASVTGALTVDEVIAVINEHYSTGRVTDVIWDLTNGTIQSFSKDDLRAISEAARAAVSNGAQQVGNTYFVGTSTVNYSKFCKYDVLAELLEMPYKYQVFKTLEEAKSIIRWSR